jgi:acyl-CoA reductase-like NAD-dependent aldehyde dehydrogenase
LTADLPEAFLSDGLRNLEDGGWTTSHTPLPHSSPVDGTVLPGPSQMTRSDVDRAVAAAVREHQDWARVHLQERRSRVLAAIDGLQQQRDLLALLLLECYLPVLADLEVGHPLAVEAPGDPLPALDFGPLISATKAAALKRGFDEAVSPLDSVVLVDTEHELLSAMNASNGSRVASIASDDLDFAARMGEDLQAFKVGVNRPRSRGDREAVFGGKGGSWEGAFVGETCSSTRSPNRWAPGTPRSTGTSQRSRPTRRRSRVGSCAPPDDEWPPGRRTNDVILALDSSSSMSARRDPCGWR